MFDDAGMVGDMDDGMIGNPDVQADFYEQQIFEDNCAVVAESSIIHQFHPEINLDQNEMRYISEMNGWYHEGGGTSMPDIGNMMEKFGVECHTNVHATAADLAWELQQGHGIVVGVNSSELWNSGPLADLQHAICKACGFDNPEDMPADHAVTVTGIDMSDPDHPEVIINDSGVQNGAAVHYPLDKFVDAWENGNCYYVATNDPLPSLVDSGIKDSQVWGKLSVADEMIADATAILTSVVTTAFTDDPVFGSEAGRAAGNFVANLLGDEDFARSI